MTKGKRILLFIVTLILLSIVYAVTNKKLNTLGDVYVVLFSSLIMLSFITLFLEHFFTKPTNVLASTIAILLLLSPLRSELSNFGAWFNLFYSYNSLLLMTSILALLFLDGAKSSFCLQNKVSYQLNRFSTFFGNGRFLFFSLFILTLIFYVDSQSKEFLILFSYSVVILLIDPQKYTFGLIRKSKKHDLDIGEIIGVQSKNTFLSKLYKERCSVKRHDFVEFKYSMDDANRVFKGLIIDNYLLNQEQWVKILATEQIRNAFDKESYNEISGPNIVYKIEAANPPEFLQRYVGVVVDRSNIEKLRFEYGSKVPVTEGNLLEVQVGESTVLYQIVQGMTETEMLESKNEAGFIVGEAIQLGLWNNERRSFEKYGWVPDINTPVFLASEIELPTLQENELQIGTIPSTNYPVSINITDAVSHHLAILGVTGSGKSVFSRNLIREIMSDDTKVICVDFTEEYRDKFSDLDIVNIVTGDKESELFEAINTLSAELDKFPNQQRPKVIEAQEKILDENFYNAIREFLESEKSISLFELPDVSNTTGILDYTKWFFKILFNIAKKEDNFGKRVCIVLEEAHTVIPEWNFIGVSEKKAQSLVNSIGQIALQGRKYKVGFIVIAQRTANVSKTVLTQCNSIIAFQQFDKTSSDFLSNYMGTAMVSALSNLKFRQAIAVGKAFKTGIPLIFEVPVINESDS